MDQSVDSIKFPEPFNQDFSRPLKLPTPETLKPDFSWTDEEGFDVAKNARNPHEIKDELAKQWNKGYIPYTQENNSTKNVLKTATKNIIVQQVRTMMNQGLTPPVIKQRLASTHKPEILSLFKPEIDNQLKLYGSVGRFVLDSRGYSDCQEAYKVASNNPFRKYMRYVMGCKCGTPRLVYREANDSFKLSEDTDSISSFLNEKTDGKKDIISACPKCGVQILSGEGDIDSQWAGDTMFDLINASNLSKEAGKTFVASKDSSYRTLKRFFIAVDNSEIQKEEEFVEVPVQEAYLPAGLEVETYGGAPVAEVDLNNEESISFLIPETKTQDDMDVILKDSDTIQLPSDKQEPALVLTHGVAPIELEFEQESPLEVDLNQKAEDSLCFKTKDILNSPILVEMGEVASEIDFNNDQDLEIGFDAPAKIGKDIIL